MVFNVRIICLLSILVAVTFSSPVKKKEPVKKSRLILEYDWPEPIKNLKRFPHPESCSLFYYTTSDGSHIIKKCPGGEIFDYQSLRCKEKAFAKCWKDLIKKIISKKGKSHFSCPFPWGLYPDTEDCSQFHECLGGKPYPRKCPASTLFDKVERTCVRENEAICADESDVIEHDGYTCPYKWGFFTHPKDCSKYYECLRKVPSIRTCKKNMLFDNFERRCLPMDSVKCGTRVNPYGSSTTGIGEVSTGGPTTGLGGVSTESATTGLGGVSTGSATTGLGGTSTGSATTALGGVSTGSASAGLGGVSTGSTKTGLGGVSTDGSTIGLEGLSTGSATIGLGGVSTGSATTALGGVSTGSAMTGLGGVSTGSATTGLYRKFDDSI